MLECWTIIVLVLCCVLIPVSQSQTVEACTALDCSLSMYILIGIAAFYALLSLVCIFLIIIACRCCKKRYGLPHRTAKVEPGSKSSPLQLIEEDEMDDIPSSLFEARPSTQTTLTTNFEFFENPSTREDSDSEHSKTSSGEEENDSFSDSNDSNQDTSLVIRNPSSATKKRGTHFTRVESKDSPQFHTTGRGSPLLHHTPKASPIPPSKVKVPFSEPGGPAWEVSPLRGGPVRLPPINLRKEPPRQRRRAAAGTPQKQAVTGLLRDKAPSRQSPFAKRKYTENEVASDTSKSTPEMRRMPQKIKNQSLLPKKPKNGTLINKSTLKFEMVKVSHKWRVIGEAFRLSTPMLNNISILSSGDSDRCMLQLCEEWMKMDKERYWEELVEVLKLERVGEKQLANYLCQYCSKTDMAEVEDGLTSKGSEGSLSWYFNHGSKVSSSGTSQNKGEEVEESVSWLDDDESGTVL